MVEKTGIDIVNAIERMNRITGRFINILKKTDRIPEKMRNTELEMKRDSPVGMRSFI
jgi:hypothetical protein